MFEKLPPAGRVLPPLSVYQTAFGKSRWLVGESAAVLRSFRATASSRFHRRPPPPQSKPLRSAYPNRLLFVTPPAKRCSRSITLRFLQLQTTCDSMDALKSARRSKAEQQAEDRRHPSSLNSRPVTRSFSNGWHSLRCVRKLSPICPSAFGLDRGSLTAAQRRCRIETS